MRAVKLLRVRDGGRIVERIGRVCVKFTKLPENGVLVVSPSTAEAGCIFCAAFLIWRLGESMRRKPVLIHCSTSPMMTDASADLPSARGMGSASMTGSIPHPAPPRPDQW